MGRDRAAYMREYRKRRKVVQRINDQTGVVLPPGMALDGMVEWREQRIAELEEEVRHLKAELAKRPHPAPDGWTYQLSKAGDRFNTRPFTPVPKRRG